MRALFESHNLVGDSLCISAALRAWHKEHPEYQIDLLTDDNTTSELYKGMGVSLAVCFGRLVREYDFEFNFDVSKAFAICDQKKCHLAQGYADLLGVKIGETAADLGPFYDPPNVPKEDAYWLTQVPADTILLAPFSRSCASHTGKPPNKCLPWAKWKPIVRYLRERGKPIRITGAASDRADELGFSEEEYLTGMPLRPLARAMKEKRISLVVSVDNGISHLAGSQKIDQILFYPMCLGLHYAVPWSNPYVIPIHNDPAFAAPQQLLWSTKQAFLQLQEMRRPDRGELLEKV